MPSIHPSLLLQKKKKKKGKTRRENPSAIITRHPSFQLSNNATIPTNPQLSLHKPTHSHISIPIIPSPTSNPIPSYLYLYLSLHPPFHSPTSTSTSFPISHLYTYYPPSNINLNTLCHSTITLIIYHTSHIINCDYTSHP